MHMYTAYTACMYKSGHLIINIQGTDFNSVAIEELSECPTGVIL